jgi:hypothetical protein
LQDQHYGLPTSSPPITNSQGDRAIARRALVEGDASLASVAYLRPTPLDAATVQAFTEQVAGIPIELRTRHPDVPEVIRSSLAFQYNNGSVFAAPRAYLTRLAGVDAAHADPPASTEQVIHRSISTRATVRGDHGRQHRGTRARRRTPRWRFAPGVLDIRVMVGRDSDVPARPVAAGWGGDAGLRPGDQWPSWAHDLGRRATRRGLPGQWGRGADWTVDTLSATPW